MELPEKNLLRRAFGVGVLGSFFGVLVCGGGAFALAQDPQVQAWARAEFRSFMLESSSADDASFSTSSDPIVSVVQAADPAVVSIVVTQEVPDYERYYERISPFGGFLLPRYRENGSHEEEVAGGTGFFISSDGYVVTNNHVIDLEKSSYTVFLNDGTSYDAALVAADDLLDVALLKVDAPDVSFAALSFGDSDMVQAGQSVIAIGNALGEYHNTVSVGVISGLSRSLFADTGDGGAEPLQDILQTDAAINPGNSGGPLLNLAGEVIGVNVAASVGGAENIGFALPANAVRFAVESMKENGRVVRPWLGVRYEMLTPDVIASESLSVDAGARIVSDREEDPAVIPDSPADRAGLREGDVVTEVDGEAVNDAHDLGYLLRLHAPGDVLTLKVLRDGEFIDVEVTLEERPTE